MIGAVSSQNTGENYTDTNIGTIYFMEKMQS